MVIIATPGLLIFLKLLIIVLVIAEISLGSILIYAVCVPPKKHNNK